MKTDLSHKEALKLSLISGFLTGISNEFNDQRKNYCLEYGLYLEDLVEDRFKKTVDSYIKRKGKKNFKVLKD